MKFELEIAIRKVGSESRRAESSRSFRKGTRFFLRVRIIESFERWRDS